MSLLDKIDSVKKKFLADIENFPTENDKIIQLRSSYLGRKGEVEFHFSSGKTYNVGTNYYFWIKEEGVNPAGTGGQKLYINSSENDGGSGNSFGRIYHKINTLTGNLITISAGDKMQIGISNQLKISGFDSALECHFGHCKYLHTGLANRKNN